MPLKTLRHVIVELDTRTTELAMGVLIGVWGLWLLRSGAVVDEKSNATFNHAMVTAGGFMVWGTWAIISCSFQLFSIHYRYPKLRMMACTSAIIYWVGIGYVFMRVAPALFMPWMAMLVALNHFWILAHRTAVIP